MTVIVFRDGVMASDSGAFSGCDVFPWARKVAKGPDGALWGFAGSAAIGSAFLAWVDSGYQGSMPDLGAGGDTDHESEVLVARPDGQLSILTKHGPEIFHEAPYLALGGADTVALGALFAGADAETAVRAAIEHSTRAAGKVQAIRW
jgi:ATP-dependent HslUV protease subunit HslV